MRESAASYGRAPSMTESTASIGPAGWAEKATTAQPEAGMKSKRPLQGKARHGAKTPPQEGEQALDEPERKEPNKGLEFIDTVVVTHMGGIENKGNSGKRLVSS